MTNFGGLVSGGEARGAMATPKFLLRSQHGQMLVTITLYFKRSARFKRNFRHNCMPVLGLAQYCLAVLGLVYIERTAGEQQLFKKESPGRDWGRPLTQVNTG